MSTVSASEWIKGISLSILASMIGGASKLAIRKSWLMLREHHEERRRRRQQQPDISNHSSSSVDDDLPPMSTDSYHAIGQDHGPSYFIDGGQEDTHGARRSTLDPDNDDHDHTGATHSLMPDETSTTTIRRDTVWMLSWFLRGSGMIGMTFLNPACSVMAMNYASPSILAPFSGLTLVWIVLLSQPLIHEKPTVRQIIAASLIIFGEILVAVFGDHTNVESMTIDKVTASYKEGPFLAYMVGTMLWMILLMIWMKYSTNPTLKRFAWGVAGGSITGFQNFLKDTLTLFQVKGNDESLPWYTGLLALLAIVTAFTGLLFLTACMKRYDATYSAAMFVGSFVVSASIMSAVHYATFAHLQGLSNLILYPGGLLVLMGGVWMLVKEKGAEVLDDVEESSAVDSAEDSIVTGSTTSPGAARTELVRIFWCTVIRQRTLRISTIAISLVFSRSLFSEERQRA
eukprot:scaffold4976_cov161-Amphora_coffeaeformis.AAC.29